MSAADRSIKPIAITLGDASGIGPEIIVKAFRDASEQMQGCVVVGDEAVLQRALNVVMQKPARQSPPLRLQRVAAWPGLPSGDLPDVIPFIQAVPALTEADLPPWGQIRARAGKLAADCVVWAANAALRGEVSALVTAPLHKEALFAAGVPFPGHTELLQACAAAHAGVSVEDMPVRMMLANQELKTVLVSIHVSLRQAIEAVTVANVLETLRITHHAELRASGRAPHMAVAGLNPHAGEGGLMGREELDVLIPAIQQARAEGLHVSGPFAPDTVFMRARAKPGQSGEFDVVVAMYHDQGLIPVKYLGVEQGVNVTLGLPLVRTSPDHGTAFDVAGTGSADASSLLAAVAMARAMRR